MSNTTQYMRVVNTGIKMSTDRFHIVILTLLLSTTLLSQNTSDEVVRGMVYTIEEEKQIPLPGANILWAGTSTGTATDSQGRFELERVSNSDLLV
ncbi:MAG: hypothetical protein HKN79_01455, partial [Flavobacteriales bacterium]|nr:hypothetical protein [Flavobacteriales bacterium]